MEERGQWDGDKHLNSFQIASVNSLKTNTWKRTRTLKATSWKTCPKLFILFQALKPLHFTGYSTCMCKVFEQISYSDYCLALELAFTPCETIPLNAHLAVTGTESVFLGIRTGWRVRNPAERGVNGSLSTFCAYAVLACFLSSVRCVLTRWFCQYNNALGYTGIDKGKNPQ